MLREQDRYGDERGEFAADMMPIGATVKCAAHARRRHALVMKEFAVKIGESVQSVVSGKCRYVTTEDME